MKNKRLARFEIFRGAISILVAIVVAAIFIFAISKEPWKALKYLLLSPLFTTRGGTLNFNLQSFYTILAAMIPKIFTGLGVCVMFSANEFNLGGEGSVLLGAFVASLYGIYLAPGSVLDPYVAVLLGGVVCGVVMLIPALGKVKLGASEMVSSLMLNYVILYYVMHALSTRYADRSQGSLMSFPIRESAKIGDLVKGNSHLTWAFVVALIATVIIWFFMYRTRWGYQIRMIGINRSFAKYSGMRVGAVVVLAQVIGGVLSGFGGALEKLGRFQTFQWRTLPGYGWVGITIAILAKNNPAYVPLASFFIAYLNKGCQLMSTYCDVPAEMIDIIQAVIFLFFAAEQFLAKHRQKIVVQTAMEEIKATEPVDGGEAHA